MKTLEQFKAENQGKFVFYNGAQGLEEGIIRGFYFYCYMEFQDFTLPKFLFCELPIKNNNNQDNRTWIYSTQHLTLIECINVDNIEYININAYYREFNYNEERWFLVLTQNNIEVTDGNVEEVLEGAWKFFSDYLKWEDKNIDNHNQSRFN